MISLTEKKRVDNEILKRVLGWWKRIKEIIEYGFGVKIGEIRYRLEKHDKS